MNVRSATCKVCSAGSLVLTVLATCAFSSSTGNSPTSVSLDGEIRAIHVDTRRIDYRGAPSLEVVRSSAANDVNLETMVMLPGTAFSDGTIDLDVAGSVQEQAAPGARGFVGLAFHVDAQASAYDLFYLRPTNGRAQDQLRRNHSVQYAAAPNHDWKKLRDTAPGVYESYADILPDRWIHMRIVVAGKHAELFVNNAAQPCLIINDLTHAGGRGNIALWLGPGTVAHFKRLSISRA